MTIALEYENRAQLKRNFEIYTHIIINYYKAIIKQCIYKDYFVTKMHVHLFH